MAALAHAHKAGGIERDPQAQDLDWRARQKQLYKHNWVVYAKTPLGGPAQVLEYLSRYVKSISQAFRPDFLQDRGRNLFD